MENSFGINIIPPDEKQRIEALKRYRILDTPPEHAFDHVAKLATQIFKVPVSLVSLVDTDKVYFKANIGMGNVKSSARGISLCSLAVLDPAVTVFENAIEEPCLLSNPNVVGEFGLKFYAGAPITTYDGFLIGTLCIIDKVPRAFTESDREILAGLAKIVMDEIELRLSSIQEIEKQHEYLEEASTINEELLIKNAQLLSTNATLQQMQEHVVLTNTKLTKSEELKELAIEQAKLGIWYIDAVTRKFMPSDRLKEFFGYDASDSMSYEDAIAQIRDDYREQVVEEIRFAVSTGSNYNLEYPIIGYKDGALRWVRETGRLNMAENGQDSYFSGTALNITEQKEDEHRKNDFISMVSHELKTPLTSMSAYLQMLAIKVKKTDDPLAVGILDKANRQVKKMTTMINGFLNMKRLETGKIQIDKIIFDMADLLKETENESLAMISGHQIIFAPVEETIIEADRDKVGQVIANFISNAVKYSPNQTAIKVACISTAGRVQVSVEDHGIGISKTDQVKLFDRFYRVEHSTMETINGFGIGLYLCYEIITRHNGRIWVESEPGKGSTFYFNLPLLKTHQERIPV